MNTPPPSVEAAREELAALRAERDAVSRFYFAVVPGGLGLALLALALLDDDGGFALLGLPLLLWGVGTGLGAIPAPRGSPRYYPNEARITYLEGYLGAHADRPPE